MARSRLLPTVALLATVLTFAGFLILGQTPIAADDDHGDVRSEATSLRVGPYTRNGVIDRSNSLDRDYFSFAAKKGASYTFVVDAVKAEKVHVMIVDPEQLPAHESRGQVVTYFRYQDDYRVGRQDRRHLFCRSQRGRRSGQRPILAGRIHGPDVRGPDLPGYPSRF